MGASVIANPLDVGSNILLDLPTDLSDNSISVVAGGFALEPDLPSNVFRREYHLAAVELESQVTWTLHDLEAVTAGIEDIRELVMRDRRPATTGGSDYVFRHRKIMTPDPANGWAEHTSRYMRPLRYQVNPGCIGPA